MQKKHNITNISKNILELSAGSAQKALSAQGKEAIYENIKEIFSNIEKENLIDLLNKKEIIFKNKDDILDTLDYINIVIFNKSKKI